MSLNPAPHGGTALPLRFLAALLVAALTGLVVGALAGAGDRRLRVIVLDTAGGSATVIRAPGGEIGLVGAGSQPDHLLTALGRVLPAASRQIDLLVLAGPSPRLVGGVAGLPGHYAVARAVLVGAISASERSEAQALQAQGTAVVAAAGGSFTWAGVGIALLPVGGADAAATGLVLAAGPARALLLGDLDPTSQEELVATAPVALGVDLVVGPPRGGVALGLLVAARPRLIAVPSTASVPDHTSWPGAEVARTAADGDVGYVADPELRRE